MTLRRLVLTFTGEGVEIRALYRIPNNRQIASDKAPNPSLFFKGSKGVNR